VTVTGSGSGVSSIDGRVVVPVALGSRSYEIVIRSRGLDTWTDSLQDWLARRPIQASAAGKALVVTDRHVVSPHADVVFKSLVKAGWQVACIELESGEQTKSLAVVARIYDELVDIKGDRQTIVVAVGGGVVGDVAGFAAATYARGIPFVQIPTTLLAQVDSSVGGKVGINHPRGKNLIGAFHQPIGVFIDATTLETLPERDYRSGLAEVIKYGVILDSDFFEYLESSIDGINRRAADMLCRVIAQSCRLKAKIVEEDEYEVTGRRAILNYGHTFAHAYEALTGYGELMHGEAVSIGMVHASRLAERLNRIDEKTCERQKRLLEAVGLPTRLPSAARLDVEAILDRMRLDKKSVGGALRFVLPTRIGHVELVDGVREDDVRAMLISALHEVNRQ